MSSFFVQGPIARGQEFIMVYRDGTTLYTLNSFTSSGIRRLFFDPRVFNTIANYQPISTVPIFVATGDLGKFQMSIKNLGGAFSYTAENKAGISAAPPDIAATSSQYAPWGPLFLSGIPYTFTRPGQQAPIIFDIGTDPSNLTGTVTSAILVPMVWYFGCSGDTANTASDLGLSVCASQCFIDPTLEQCQSSADSYCAGIPSTAWTTGAECKEGTVYSYCPAGSFCSISCKGPCNSSFNVCVPATDGVGYSCKFTPDNIFTGRWWTRPWFIISMIVLFIIIIIVIIVVFNAISKNKSSGGKGGKEGSSKNVGKTTTPTATGTIILTS